MNTNHSGVSITFIMECFVCQSFCVDVSSDQCLVSVKFTLFYSFEIQYSENVNSNIGP